MLVELHIKNYALIDELHLSFEPELNVFTGETGAGKSILIDALNLVLGNRADSNFIRTGTETSTVEALFDIHGLKPISSLLDELGYSTDDPDQLLLRREISRSGKNRCWVGGQLSTLAILQQLSQELVDLHGQHEHQSLLKSAKQLDILDEFAETNPLRDKFGNLYRQILDIRQELEHLKQSDSEKQRLVENYHHQINEIESAELKEDEEESLNQQRQILRYSEKLLHLINAIQQELNGTDSDLNKGIIASLGKVKSSLIELLGIDSSFESLVKQLEPMNITMKQINHEIMLYQEKVNLDPQLLEHTEERLDLIHRLKRKFIASTVSELLAMKTKWKMELDGLTHQEERMGVLEKQLKLINNQLTTIGIQLSDKRTLAAKRLSKQIESELTELGMKHSTFKIDVQKIENPNGFISHEGKSYSVSFSGMNTVEFLFSANPGESVKPLSKVISGGELSRVMLALKTIFATSDQIPTLIFDEIDVGIGGAMASTVSRKLREISREHQVLVITHLPVIAAAGKTHFQVTKIQDSKQTVARIQKSTPDERVQEIARMTSGDLISTASVTHAKELLDQLKDSTTSSNKIILKKSPKKKVTR